MRFRLLVLMVLGTYHCRERRLKRSPLSAGPLSADLTVAETIGKFADALRKLMAEPGGA